MLESCNVFMSWFNSYSGVTRELVYTVFIVSALWNFMPCIIQVRPGVRKVILVDWFILCLISGRSSLFSSRAIRCTSSFGTKHANGVDFM